MLAIVNGLDKAGCVEHASRRSFGLSTLKGVVYGGKLPDVSVSPSGGRFGSSIEKSPVGVGHLSLISDRYLASSARKRRSRRSGTSWKPSVGTSRLKMPRQNGSQ